MKLKCIAVDDESLARKLLEENIRQIPFLELVRTCKNAYEAMQVLQEERVDLMFLDIQMPGMLGTKFLAGLRDKPLVIFVTAYSDYAVESYDLEVVDYLMKPVSLERFTRAAHRALEVWQKKQQPVPSDPGASPASTGVSPASQAGTARPPVDYFLVKVEYSLVKVAVADVTHIEGMKDYVKIFLRTGPRPILTKSTLKSIEEKLPPEGFMRVHKSYIVSLDKIETIRNHMISIGSHEIPVSEANMEELLRQLRYEK
jgi:DNA-binding LytR/AlgR family response regulator